MLNSLNGFRQMVWCATIITLLAFANTSLADRALLIGVGKYANSAYDLNGIDLDIQTARTLMLQMGIPAKNIKILQNSEATLKNTLQTIENWLIKDTKKNERVIFYFSGHGTQIDDINHDEIDGADEVLALHDFSWVATATGKARVKGVLVDDQLNALLNKIPSQQIFVLVDACNSGTVTKSIQLRSATMFPAKATSMGQVKYLTYPGMPQTRSTAGHAVSILEDTTNNVVALSATRDHEKATATENGSIFTQALQESINKAIRTQTNRINFAELAVETTSFIKANIVDKSQHFHPQITGNEKLAQHPWVLTQVQVQAGPVWQALETLMNKSRQTFNISAQRDTFMINDFMDMTLDIPWSGYLNIIEVGEDDQPTILFPNQHKSINQVKKGQMNFPPLDAMWGFQANKIGRSLTVAFLSTHPINLYQLASKEPGENGKLDVFAALNQAGILTLHETMQRNFTVAPRPNRAAKIATGRLLTKVEAVQAENTADGASPLLLLE